MGYLLSYLERMQLLDETFFLYEDDQAGIINMADIHVWEKVHYLYAIRTYPQNTEKTANKKSDRQREDILHQK